MFTEGSALKEIEDAWFQWCGAVQNIQGRKGSGYRVHNWFIDVAKA